MDNQPISKLDNLPEELLESIFALLTPPAGEYHGDFDILDLWKISLTSRKFHRIVEPFLYRNVQALGVFDGRPYPPHKTHKLVRTLKARPDLAQHARAFRAYDKFDSSWNRDGATIGIVVNLLPNLEHLDMSRPSANLMSALESRLFGELCNEPGPQALRTLKAYVREGSPLDLVRLFQLPALEEATFDIITIHISRFSGQYRSQQDMAWHMTTSSLKKLSFINMCAQVFFRPDEIEDVFGIIANSCPLLGFFNISFTGYYKYYKPAFSGLTAALKNQLRNGALRHFGFWSDVQTVPQGSLSWPVEVLSTWHSQGVKVDSLKLDSAFFQMGYRVLPQAVRELTLVHEIPFALRERTSNVLLEVRNNIQRELLPNLETVILETSYRTRLNTMQELQIGFTPNGMTFVVS